MTKGNSPPPDIARAALEALGDAVGRVVFQRRRPSAEPPSPATAVPPPALVVVDERGRVQAFDPAAEQLWACSASEVLQTPVERLLDPAPLLPGRPTAATVRRRDGTTVAAAVSRHELDLDGRMLAILDVHVHGPSRGPALASEVRYRNLVEQIPAVVFTAALEGGVHDLYVSPQIESLLGYTQEEWLRDPVLWYERLHPDDRRALDQEFARGCATGGPFRAQCRFLARDGRVVWVHGEARLIREPGGAPLLLQGVAFDISETKRAEEVVRASLREKELLLKEIHHRVKNNLQITSSLLRLQVAHVSDATVRGVLRESQDRIRSMALVHEMLYRSPDLSRVDFGAYARALVQQLFRSHNVDPQRVAWVVDIGEVGLGVDDAVPCGLLLNELVTNALKHAFPRGRAGHVRVYLHTEPARYVLSVRDDGVGFPPQLDFRRTESLGLQLVRTLADQLAGSVELKIEGGTEFIVTFPRQAAA